MSTSKVHAWQSSISDYEDRGSSDFVIPGDSEDTVVLFTTCPHKINIFRAYGHLHHVEYGYHVRRYGPKQARTRVYRAVVSRLYPIDDYDLWEEYYAELDVLIRAYESVWDHHATYALDRLRAVWQKREDLPIHRPAIEYAYSRKATFSLDAHEGNVMQDADGNIIPFDVFNFHKFRYGAFHYLNY